MKEKITDGIMENKTAIAITVIVLFVLYLLLGASALRSIIGIILLWVLPFHLIISNLDMSEIAKSAHSVVLTQSKQAISEHAQKHAPYFSTGRVFDISKDEKIIFSFFSALVIMPSLAYWLSFAIPFRISILIAPLFLAAIGILLRLRAKPKINNNAQ